VPIGISRYPEIAAAAIFVDPRHYAMVAIFKTGVDGVDLVSGGQGTVKDGAAFLGPEVAGIRCGDLCDQTKCAGDRPQQARRNLDAVVARLRQRRMKHRSQVLRIFDVAIQKN
jgi:hypothetical protein